MLAAHADGATVSLDTSATSGSPRAVVRTTASWFRSFSAVEQLSGLGPGSRLWLSGPLGSTMNLFAAVHAATLSIPLVGTPRQATHAVLTPSNLLRLLDAEVPARLVVIVAGDRLTPALHDRAVAAGLVVHHYYGAAELSFVAWGPHAEALRPFPGVEVAVRHGEIWVRSPYVCLGYDGPSGSLRRGPDGFMTVGDRGAMVDGRLQVAGRPGAVSVGGTVVETADVEAVLRGSSARGEVVVVGLPHPRLGHVLAAVLTEPADLPMVRATARQRLVGPHRPRLWFHLSELPVTAAGKTDRDAVAARVSGDAGAARRLV